MAAHARGALGKMRRLRKLADHHPFILGVIGWADFISQKLPVIPNNIAVQLRPLSFRKLIHDIADPEYVLSSEHTSAVRARRERSLTYDLLLRPEHPSPATAFVDPVTDRRFVVRHVAKLRFERGSFAIESGGAADRAAGGSIR